MQEEVQIDITATTTVVVKSEVLINALKLSIDFHKRQMDLNPPPIDKSNTELLNFRKRNYDFHKEKHSISSKLVHWIESAGAHGGFKIKIED